MEWRISDLAIPLAAAVLGTVLIGVWIQTGPALSLDMRVPGMDRRGKAAQVEIKIEVPVAGQPQSGPGTPSSVSGIWPCFRGPQHDGISRDPTPLARKWPESGPPVLWTVELTEGYASPAIVDGRVLLLDYDEQTRCDTMRCLSLDDGREIWRNSYPVELTRNHGISRTVPAVAKGLVVSIGPRCQVACWDVETGQCRWLIDMVERYKTEVPRWYTGQCPLIDGDRLILAPAGTALVVAMDLETGKVLWETPNPKRWKMTHASVMPMEFQGQRTYVYCASGAVVGVAAEDGHQLWESTAWTVKFATAPSPVILPEGKIFLSSGYGSKVGALMLQLKNVATSLQAESLFTLAPRQFNSEQQTPIFYKGHLFGIRKQGGGQIVCMKPDGSQVWDSGQDRLGHGPYMLANDVILAMSNDGRLVMAEASTDQYRRLAEFQVFENGHDAWGPMAMVAGRLIVRDMSRMSCLDLSASHQPSE